MVLIEVEVYPEKRITHFTLKETNLARGDWCVFKLKEGMGIGKVRFIGRSEEKTSFIGSEKLRKATPEDRQEFERRQEIEKKAYEAALEKISFHKLPMKLITTKYPLGDNRITFYYAAKQRIDFRVLVKDLASVFKLRMQMQQIGVRDEPQLLGSYGICGRPVCCASFLNKRKLDSVSLKAARVQNLPLASSKISGICGRLRCCLNFEYPTYSALKRKLPRIGQTIHWQNEKVKVIAENILKGSIVVETKEGVRQTLTEKDLARKK